MKNLLPSFIILLFLLCPAYAEEDGKDSSVITIRAGTKNVDKKDFDSTEHGSSPQEIQNQRHSPQLITNFDTAGDINRNMQKLEEKKEKASKKKEERAILKQQQEQLLTELKEITNELASIRKQLTTMGQKAKYGHTKKYTMLAMKNNNLIATIKEKDAEGDSIKEHIAEFDKQIAEFYGLFYEVQEQVAEALRDPAHAHDDYLIGVKQKLDKMFKDFKQEQNRQNEAVSR